MLYIEGEEARSMTIKELETSLGMTRANIRFYEQEGFLSPARGANNYRIYSGRMWRPCGSSSSCVSWACLWIPSKRCSREN